MTIHNFYANKRDHKKISMITCYDYTSAQLLNQSSVDCLLVGDSVAMTMHGFKDTLSATMPMMLLHTQAVARGAPDKFIVADLPFLSYRKDMASATDAAGALMQAGAHAVKLEGASGNINIIQHLVESGIPVMGHLGLTPQFVHQFGGYKVQGKDTDSADRIKHDASLLESAGCFSIVLECIPHALAQSITEQLNIATIGIGAGVATDGQVLVWHDLLGLNTAFKPKFVKQFLNGHDNIKTAIDTYITEVTAGAFPNHEHHY